MIEISLGPLDSTLCGLAEKTLVEKTLNPDTQHFPWWSLYSVLWILLSVALQPRPFTQTRCAFHDRVFTRSIGFYHLRGLAANTLDTDT